MKVTKITQGIGKKLVGGSLPDIDTDFSGEDRGTIKEYMEDRFVKENVCSVGIYTTFKPKGMIKDFAKLFEMDFAQANSVTFKLKTSDEKLIDILKRSQTEPLLKEFLKKNTDIFYMMSTLLNQQKTEGIHACAVIVMPTVMSANEWAPMRKTKGVLISQWGGGEMDDAGFLKNDILGLAQLSKFTEILNLAEENGKDIPDIYNLPLEDKEVFRFFSNGWTGDIFQMGSEGLTSYIKSMKPNSLDDIIATMALYRPGPMENGFHETYIKCKNEGMAPDYLWGTEEITKDTFGLLVYQEQIMRIFTELGGLSLKDADDIRRALGKKDASILKPWKEILLKGFLERGATVEIFEKMWEIVLEFAKYSFNKSHSAAYGITAYISQYLKVHFPIEFWTVALDHAKEDKTAIYLSEILQSKSINLKAVDINGSNSIMTSNLETSTIFWGISSIKGIGEDTAEQIILERNENGNYTSLEDFLRRSIYTGSKIKKTAVEGLIASGGFDEVENIEEGFENRRTILIQNYREACKVKIAKKSNDIYSEATNENIDNVWFWKKRQKELTGLSFINYEQIAEEGGYGNNFLKNRELNTRQQKGIFKTFGGYVTMCKIGNTKKGKYARLVIENNYKLHKVIIWADEYQNFSAELKGCEKKIMIFSAELKYEATYTKGNQFTLKPNSFLRIL
jgi:DNA polymerase-3 subunit alpha